MRKLTLSVLGGAFLALVAAAPATAQQPAQPPAVQVTDCNGISAFTDYKAVVSADGKSVTLDWTTRPGCEDRNVGIAGYRTAFAPFNPAEFQPGLPASTVQQLAGTSGHLEFVMPADNGPIPSSVPGQEIPADACKVQVDGFTGEVLPWIGVNPADPTKALKRYNEFVVGGSRSRLIFAFYLDSVCGTPPATTSTTAPPPSTTTPTTTPTTEAPPTTTPTTEAPPTTTRVSSVPTPQPTVPGMLPFTGGKLNGLQILAAVLSAALLISAGLVSITAGNRRAARSVR